MHDESDNLWCCGIENEFEITLHPVYHIFTYMDLGGKVCPVENILHLTIHLLIQHLAKQWTGEIVVDNGCADIL